MSGIINSIGKFISKHSVLFGKLGEAVLIIVISLVVVKIGKFIIKKFFERRKLFKHGISGKKIDTVASLCISIFKYAVYLIALISILSDVCDIKSILAAAGIGGVAVGFGAQSLIKDVISGFFIVLEDQFAVGDQITVDSLTGTVESLELRVTRLRNSNGDLHVVPNGEIRKMTNHTRGCKLAVVDIPLPYEADIEKALAAAGEVCEKAGTDFEDLIEKPSVLGVIELNKEGLVLRVTAKTKPSEQTIMERKLRKLILKEFRSEKIKPFS
ncbi:MAG: mechanosensitive ion channel family protein [Bacillota bacterium]|nr:mechanosensitive ion channel family protein [Bacillota bacterium]